MILGLIWIVEFFWALIVGIFASKIAEKITKTYKLFCKNPQSFNSVSCLTSINGIFWALMGAIGGHTRGYNIAFYECMSKGIGGHKPGYLCENLSIVQSGFSGFPGAFIGAGIGLVINLWVLQSLKKSKKK